MTMSGLSGGLDSASYVQAQTDRHSAVIENPNGELVSDQAKKFMDIIKNLGYSLPKTAEISR
ncbi:MAG: hypothetical protein AABZ74_14145 [Cyanobacteriota bacterium]